MISAYMVPTVKHGGEGVMVWGCYDGDTVYNLFRIQGTQPAWLPQHSAVIRHPIWFSHSGTIFCFSTGQWPNTPPGCIRAIWPRKRVMECCIRWPCLHNHPTSTQLRWFGLDRRVKEKQPTSAQHLWALLQDCWKRIPGELGWENAKSVQSCHQGKGWLLWRISNITCILIWLTLFRLLLDSICFIS